MCEPLGQQCKIIIFIAPYLGRSALYIRLVKVYSFLQAYSMAFCWIMIIKVVYLKPLVGSHSGEKGVLVVGVGKIMEKMTRITDYGLKIE